jgi:hypothetical protein
MKNLRFVGGDDIRELSPDDLQKLGVEDAEATLRFKKGASTTLEDDVADILLERIPNLREATEAELKQEERDLEVELGFELYNPAEHTVAEVISVLATSTDQRRRYILDQEQAGQNRKTIFQAVGADWLENPPPTEGEEVDKDDVMTAHEADDLDLAAQAAPTAEAGSQVQTSQGSGTGGSGKANTSPDA